MYFLLFASTLQSTHSLVSNVCLCSILSWHFHCQVLHKNVCYTWSLWQESCILDWKQYNISFNSRKLQLHCLQWYLFQVHCSVSTTVTIIEFYDYDSCKKDSWQSSFYHCISWIAWRYKSRDSISIFSMQNFRHQLS